MRKFATHLHNLSQHLFKGPLARIWDSVLRHVDRAYCLLVYNARKIQTITITTTMVPNSPYPNIVASSGFLGFRIPMNHFAPSALRCMFDLAHNSNNLWDTAVLLRRFNAGFIFLARWLLVAFPHSLNSCKCGSIGFLLAEPLSNGIPAMRHLARMFDTHISSHFVRKTKVALLGFFLRQLQQESPFRDKD